MVIRVKQQSGVCPYIYVCLSHLFLTLALLWLRNSATTRTAYVSVENRHIGSFCRPIVIVMRLLVLIDWLIDYLFQRQDGNHQEQIERTKHHRATTYIFPRWRHPVSDCVNYLSSATSTADGSDTWRTDSKSRRRRRIDSVSDANGRKDGQHGLVDASQRRQRPVVDDRQRSSGRRATPHHRHTPPAILPVTWRSHEPLAAVAPLGWRVLVAPPLGDAATRARPRKPEVVEDVGVTVVQDVVEGAR